MMTERLFERRERWCARLFFIFTLLLFVAVFSCGMYSTSAVASTLLSLEFPAHISYQKSPLYLEQISVINGPENIVNYVRKIAVPMEGSYLTQDDIVEILVKNGVGGIRLSLLMPKHVELRQETRLQSIVRSISGWTWAVEVKPLSEAVPQPSEDYISPGTLSPGVGSTTLKFRSNGGIRSIPVRISWYQPAVVLQRECDRGHVITENDVILRRVQLSQSGELPSRVESVVGLALKRDGRYGDVISFNFLETKPIIYRGDEVTIISRMGTLIVEVSGEALDEGVLGDRVRVRNNRSRTVVTGRVVGPGKVEVDSE